MHHPQPIPPLVPLLPYPIDAPPQNGPSQTFIPHCHQTFLSTVFEYPINASRLNNAPFSSHVVPGHPGHDFLPYMSTSCVPPHIFYSLSSNLIIQMLMKSMFLRQICHIAPHYSPKYFPLQCQWLFTKSMFPYKESQGSDSFQVSPGVWSDMYPAPYHQWQLETTQQAHWGTLGNPSKGTIAGESDCRGWLGYVVYWQLRLL